jgi:four helix bundle protein
MQVRRSVLSIVANLAEGAGSGSRPMAAWYFRIASASAHESEAILLVARSAEILPRATVDDWLLELGEIKRMLSGLLRAVAVPRRKAVSPSR